MSPGWWVVKLNELYFLGSEADSSTQWSTSQGDARQFPHVELARSLGAGLGGRVVRVRARVPARGLDFETALGNSKARSV